MMTLAVPPVTGRPVPRGLPAYVSLPVATLLRIAMQDAGVVAPLTVRLGNGVIEVPGRPALQARFRDILAGYQPLPAPEGGYGTTWEHDVAVMLGVPL